ncbi:hypothetical protein H2204_008454 [Knufia peltigerae]|uniref:Aminoglycoside phosphotransferase domain-containing protein n=1 Tax=Knufia peltigerae TaxID=1002370 RepID=A0AA38Y005_9EURO|nr:hypothetical protein H2204_008454 [Knufia peltigerae]
MPLVDYESGNPPIKYDYRRPDLQYKNVRPGQRFEGARNPPGTAPGCRCLASTCKTEEECPFRADESFLKTFSRENELCWACGWTIGCQSRSYSPRLKIMHVRYNIGLWDLGSHWVLRDYPDDGTAGNGYMTHVYLREHLGRKIPIVEEMRLFPAPPINFTVESRAQGKQLMAIWHTLSRRQIRNYQDQMVDILKHMRQLTAPRPQKVNGDRLGDCLTCICDPGHPPWCVDIGFTDEEWLENLAGDIRWCLVARHGIADPEVLEERFQEVKDTIPDNAPFVMTHADLNLTNIIVKDDKIEAIVDWEMAGFYPWWAERFRVMKTGGPTERFFRGVWDRVHPDLKEDHYGSKVYSWKVFEAKLRNYEGEHEPEDPNDHPGGYVRGPFCRCHPAGGYINPRDAGVRMKHTPRDWRKLMKENQQRREVEKRR